MANNGGDSGGGGDGDWRWWAAASTCQLAAGLAAYRRGSGEGDAVLMPFKAFAVATLLVGAGATAAAGWLAAAGIDTVDDMKRVGEGVRRWLGASSSRN